MDEWDRIRTQGVALRERGVRRSKRGTEEIVLILYTLTRGRENQDPSEFSLFHVMPQAGIQGDSRKGGDR